MTSGALLVSAPLALFEKVESRLKVESLGHLNLWFDIDTDDRGQAAVESHVDLPLEDWDGYVGRSIFLQGSDPPMINLPMSKGHRRGLPANKHILWLIVLLLNRGCGFRLGYGQSVCSLLSQQFRSNVILSRHLRADRSRSGQWLAGALLEALLQTHHAMGQCSPATVRCFAL